MKNILLIIALFAFLNSYATDPLSWGKKGGSGGVTQSQLDAKVDTSLIITGQEALDSLTADIGRTVYATSDNIIKSNVSNGTLISLPDFYDYASTATKTATDGGTFWTRHTITKDTVINYIDIAIYTIGNYTEVTDNSVSLYKIVGDSVELVVSISTTNIWQTSPTSNQMLQISLGSDYTLKKGIYFTVVQCNWSGTPTVTPLFRYSSIPVLDYFGDDIYFGYSKSFVSVVMPDTYAISDLSPSASILLTALHNR